MKKIIALLCVLFVLMPFHAYAHSKLTESSPEANATVTASPEQITLKFNTSISSASRISLLNENGDKLSVENVTVNEDTISGQVTEQLNNGSYTVTWNIIGADGHAVEGSYSFLVEQEEATEPTATAAADNEVTDEAASQETEEPAVTPTPTPAETADLQANDEELSEEKDNQPIWPYIVIAVIVAAVLVFALRKRK